MKRGARPVRLVAAGILLLLLVTGTWLWYQARLDEAAAVLADAQPAAEAAIAEGDLLEAAAQMGAAADAVGILGRNDAAARRIRQRHRELVAITEAASLTPFELAAEATRSTSDPERWSRRFTTLYAGQWVILDVPLGRVRPATSSRKHQLEERVEQANGSERKEDGGEGTDETSPGRSVEEVIPLKLPLWAGEMPVRLELEADRFEELMDSRRAILALRYRSWRMAADGQAWVVRFDSESSFLWVSGDLYEAAGFELDDEILPAREQLATQAKMVEVPGFRFQGSGLEDDQ